MILKRKTLVIVIANLCAANGFHTSTVYRRVERRNADVASMSSSSMKRTAHCDEGPSSSRQRPASRGDMERREAISLFGLASSGLVIGFIGTGTVALAADPSSSSYKPARRPTAYRVDSTIPPTLLPIKSAGKEKKVLEALGRGSGTEKDAIVVDTVNLNNMLNKAVFGTVDAVESLSGRRKDESRVGPDYSSFVCLGVPSKTTSDDIDLALSLLSTILQPRKSSQMATALGLAVYPYSTQPSLDAYVEGTKTEEAIATDLAQAGVPEETTRLYVPLLRMAKSNGLKLLALAPEVDDVKVTRSRGLQNVDPDRRAAYVVDPEGFVAVPNDPKYQLYTDRSLFKDFEPVDSKDTIGNFFAERILVHEAAATAMASYAMKNPESLVAMVAPTPDLRFLGGMNGRIPRVCRAVNANSKVTDNAVTTILLNPTAEETLSRTRYLRLEIGTGPDTLPYQTKVADYLWFSAMPKVNMIPRLMEG
jgi:Haem-binding uptake, Tiki superfamily, ChaN